MDRFLASPQEWQEAMFVAAAPAGSAEAGPPEQQAAARLLQHLERSAAPPMVHGGDPLFNHLRQLKLLPTGCTT